MTMKIGFMSWTSNNSNVSDQTQELSTRINCVYFCEQQHVQILKENICSLILNF